MSGYRPLGLSPSAGSTIIAGRATSYAERRRAVAERLSRTADITRHLDEAVAGPPVAPGAEPGSVDPDGTLRASIRALLPLAHRAESFDVTVSLGPDHAWAARIRRGPDGVTAELVPAPSSPSSPSSTGVAGSGPAVRPPAVPGSAAAGPGSSARPSEAQIATELAALLRTREVGAR